MVLIAPYPPAERPLSPTCPDIGDWNPTWQYVGRDVRMGAYFVLRSVLSRTSVSYIHDFV